MTRIPYIDKPEGLSEEQKQAYDHIYQSRKSVMGIFSLLLNSPPIATLTGDLGAYLRFDSILSERHKELVILVTVSENYCQFEWSAHEELALKASIPQTTIDIIKYKQALDGLSPEDSAIVTYARELINDKRVSDPVFASVKQLFSNQEITEITALIGYYSMVACSLNAYELGPIPGKPKLPEPELASSIVQNRKTA